MKKILIVEDEVAYSSLLQAELEKVNYEVVVAKNGKEGLAKASSEHPDLIILDVRMPVMDGTEMLKQLRNTEFGATVIVVMLTNFEPDKQTLGNVIKDEATYYLIKSDITIDELKSKIATIFVGGFKSEK